MLPFKGIKGKLVHAICAVGIGIILSPCFVGIIKLASTAGTYLVDAYPVELVFSDIILIFITVTSMGFIASYIATRRLNS